MEEGSIPTPTAASLARSLDSIEAALGRIEAASLVRRELPSAALDDDLQLRHAELQSAVEQALLRIDILIEEQP